MYKRQGQRVKKGDILTEGYSTEKGELALGKNLLVAYMPVSYTHLDVYKRQQFYMRTMDCTGEITLPEGTEMVRPGDNVTITVELIYPVALNPGLRFAIREGGRTVGAGQITEIID